MTTKTKKGNGNGKGSNADVMEVTKQEKGTTVVTPDGKLKNQDKKEPETKKTELSLDEKIAKVENLKVLIEKREKLQDSRKKLNSFVIGSHNFSENIVLTDEQGNTFKTSNSEVFSKCVEVIRDTLDTKIREIESEISF